MERNKVVLLIYLYYETKFTMLPETKFTKVTGEKLSEPKRPLFPSLNSWNYAVFRFSYNYTFSAFSFLASPLTSFFVGAIRVVK